MDLTVSGRLAKDEAMTEWKRCTSPYGNYQVSDDGQVRRGSRILRTATDRYGYARVGLYYAGLRQRFKVHRLVCQTFHGPAPTDRHEVLHVDGNKANNAPSNLRWGTRLENVADSIRHGSFFNVPPGGIGGERHPGAKLTAQQVESIRTASGVSQRALAGRFHISQTQVCHIRQGKQWAS